MAPWNKVAKQIFVLSEQANFFCFRPTCKKFPAVLNGPEKRKNFYLVKLASKWKSAIRKGHTSFLVFIFGIWN